MREAGHCRPSCLCSVTMGVCVGGMNGVRVVEV